MVCSPVIYPKTRVIARSALWADKMIGPHSGVGRRVGKKVLLGTSVPNRYYLLITSTKEECLATAGVAHRPKHSNIHTFSCRLAADNQRIFGQWATSETPCISLEDGRGTSAHSRGSQRHPPTFCMPITKLSWTQQRACYFGARFS